MNRKFEKPNNKEKATKQEKRATNKTKRTKKTGEPIVLEFNLSKTVAIITTIIFILSAILTTKIVQTIIVAKEEKSMASADESTDENTDESANESAGGSANEESKSVTWVESKTKTSYLTDGEIDYETDAEGNETAITVPVPEGYTASEVVGETSRDTGFVIYEGDINWNEVIDASEYSSDAPISSISLKRNTNDSTQWILLDDGTYASGYKTSEGNIYGSYNIDSTTNVLETEEFTLTASETVTFDWAVSSETSDYLYYVITNTKTNETVETSTSISGTSSGTSYSELSFATETIELELGTYKIEFIYVKDDASSSGLDAGFVKNIKISSEIEIPIFVIDTDDGETYHWSQYDDGTYVSGYSGSGGNYNVNSSTNTLTSNEFTLEETATLKFDWSVSSQTSYDYLYYTITNTSTGTTTGGTSTKISGTGYASSYDSLTFNEVSVSLEAGTYTVKFSYYKNGSTNSGLDAGFVKNIRVEQDGANLTGYDNRDISGKSGTYNWSEYEEGVWSSGFAKEGTVYGNYNINNSTSTVETEEFILEKGSKITFDWAVSSESNDYLYYTITGSTSTGTSVTKGGTSTKISGTTSGTSYSELNYSTETNYLDAGTYKIEFIYVKDSTTSSGLDAGFVKGIQSVQACTETEKRIFNLQKTVNQYVWVPIDDISEICGIDSTGKLWGKLYLSYGGTSRSKTNGVMKISSMTGYREPDVTKNNTDYDTDNYFAKYSLGQTKYEMLAKEQEKEFYNAMESIEKYGGFYIGRYETSVSNSIGMTKKMASLSSTTWYNYYKYKYCEKMCGTNDNVWTSMIWGSLWDATLDWFVDSGATTSTYVGQLEDGYRGKTITNSYLTSSTYAKYLGNYYNATFTYIKSGAEYPIHTETKVANSSVGIQTGATDFTKINNIYDMGGNYQEWTLEAYSAYYRVRRGGDYCGDGNYPSYRNNGSPTISLFSSVRGVLYIK